MSTILICPDKFKGSLTAEEVCQAVKEGVQNFDPDCNCILHPLADGGEGTLEALESSMQLKTEELTVSDPLFRPITASYRRTDDVAFVEMSRASGLQLLQPEERNCMDTTTLGTGELIKHAIEQRVKQVYLFVGGSATNDAGVGMATALGFRFLDDRRNKIDPIGKELFRIEEIDQSQVLSGLGAVKFTVVCDVKNPFYGKNGAAYAYGAQKGASPEEIRFLDEGLAKVNQVVRRAYGIDLVKLEGSGAAGGIAGGAVAYLGAAIRSGIHSVMDITGFRDKLVEADLVITGEGKLDYQTVEGKVVDGVYEAASELKKKVAIVCGVAEDQLLISKKIKAPIYQIKTEEVPLEEAINNAYNLLIDRSFQLMKEFMAG